MASTHINIDRLEEDLTDHPDRVFVATLVSGLMEGFDTGLQVLPSESMECRNLRSAQAEAEFVTEALLLEVEKGYVIGPYATPPFPVYRVSPLGVAIGKYSGKKRLIIDLSAPHDNPRHKSLNELINKDNYSLSYVRIDDAIQAITRYGRDAGLCKCDIVDAFKLCPIKPELWHLYGVKWQGEYYFYCRLAFGSRSSPKLFDYLSQAVCWIAHHKYGIECIFHLLDDF